MAVHKKADGVYEEIISQKLQKELVDIEPEYKFTEKLDPNEAPAILADYAAKIIKHRLRMVQENEGKISDQIRLVNKLIDVIADDTMDYQNEKVADPGEQLKALLQNNPITKVTKMKASDLIRPVTSIADSSLFTGAGREPNMSSEINKEIASCDRIDMMVSFIRWSGVVLILDELKKFVESGKKLRVITTSYMGATELRAIEELSKLPNTEIKVSFDGDRTRLHAKVYIFHRESGYSTAYVGSSNLTAPAMTSGCEWNVKVTKSDLPEIFSKIEASYSGYWNSKEFEDYSEDKREALKEALSRSGKRDSAVGVKRSFYFDIYPYPYQQAILDKLDAERNIRNSYRNLICAATGTGKTLISAFDYRKQCEIKKKKLKLLFVAHRREILEQSLECYREVLKDSEFGNVFYSGQEADQVDYLFASIDILNSRKFTELNRDYYDYIVLDECHHLAAKSYRTLFDHFTPEFLLGLTATPERMDGENILPYFNNKLAAEIRLPEAINRKLLCPFQYFGVADSVDLSNLKWTRGGYDKSELENVYALNRGIADKRAKLIIQSIYKYVADIDAVKGLVFCVSIEHAKYMTEKLNEVDITTTYLTGSSTDKERMLAKQKLQDGELKFICVVDLYNEGVDIKQINTVLFLRPTESLTVFLQQLGRGLRLAEGKDCLTVLDFIGQANKRYSFENKYASLLQKNNQGMKKEVEAEFPHLPRGCYIKLEKKAKERILSNIRSSLIGKAGVISKLTTFEGDTGTKVSLRRFLDYYSMTPKMIYTHKITVTGTVKNMSGNIDQEMWKKLFRLSSVDSVSCLQYLINHIETIGKLRGADITQKEWSFLKLAYATFIDNCIPKNDEDILLTLKTYLNNNIEYIPEIIDVLQYNFEHVDFLEKNPGLPYENVLYVYSTYTRAQALALLDYWKTSSEGVTRVKDKRATCLFVTLNKGNSYYSPSTAYHDYSINEELFHWQSQNATASNTSVGQRYIHHEEQKEDILLFVREQKDDSYGSVPFMFLGKAKYVSHQGDKPMSIVWKLENKIPAKFIDVTDKLGIG